MAEPIYKLEKLNFDGPLDLLLKLLEKNKVDIYDIPIAEITNQYLDYVQSMEEADLDIISAFLVMATTLLDIKSRMLLPKEETEEEDETDPREELVNRLLEYKRYKYISKGLRQYEELAEGYLYKDAELPEELKSYVPPVDLDQLLNGVDMELLGEVYERVMKRMKSAVNTAVQGFGVIRKERVSLVKCIEGLRNYARGHRKFSFRQMLNSGADKTEVVVSFLAVLELMKLGKITATQEEPDDELEVEVISDADLDDIDLSNIIDE